MSDMKLSERMFEEAQAAADVWGDKSPLATLPAEWAEEVTQMEIETADLTRENIELVRRLAEAETHTSAFRDLTARSGAMRDEVGELVTRYDELLAWGHELETENRALSAMLRASARRTVSARRWHHQTWQNKAQGAQQTQRWLKSISRALGTPWGGAQQHSVDLMVQKALTLRERLARETAATTTWDNIVDDLVDVWHTTEHISGQAVPLHTFLGMTWEQYAPCVNVGGVGWDAIPEGVRSYIYAQHERWVAK